MATEIERKFLVKNDNWRSLSKSAIKIEQGYLNTAVTRTVRIRTSGNRAFLTVKGKSTGAFRSEFEYEIPYEDALEMLALCEEPRIQKTRYIVEENNQVWEIDEFEGVNKGLIVAEIELKNESQIVSKPEWLGKEVTDDSRYYNSALILHPYSTWKSSQNR